MKGIARESLLSYPIVRKLIYVSFHFICCREKMTMSVFILSGTALKATALLEGPIASLEVNSGIALNEAVEKFNDAKKKALLAVNELVDFEHLNDSMDEEDDDEAEEEEPPIDSEDPDSDEKKKLSRQRQRERFLEVKRKRERRRIAQQKKIRQDGDPFLYTEKAPEAGWYRVCVEGTWHQVSEK
jgi:hypothetical protein